MVFSKRKAESGKPRSWVYLFRFVLRIAVTTILMSSSVSCLRDANLCGSKTLPSSSNSSHNSDSSNSCSTIPSLATNSASDLAREASRKFAATLVPDRSNCRPSVPAKTEFGSAPYNRMMRDANAFVRSRKGAMRIARPHSAFRFPLWPQFHPCASRTRTIAPRMSFQVSCFSITAFGNMQPSQQMWRMPRSGASLSQ